MTEQNVMLVRNNQFGLNGPQAGDIGVSSGTYRLPNMDVLWHQVVFDDYPDREFCCPDPALQVLTERNDNDLV